MSLNLKSHLLAHISIGEGADDVLAHVEIDGSRARGQVDRAPIVGIGALQVRQRPAIELALGDGVGAGSLVRERSLTCAAVRGDTEPPEAAREVEAAVPANRDLVDCYGGLCGSGGSRVKMPAC